MLRQDLRKLLMRLLRDSDYNVRLLATEGFCKLLICERMQNPWDFIARLIMLYFEKPKTEMAELSDKQKALFEKIKSTIEEFFTYFPRLASDRCVELFEATILAIYYLIKSRALQSSDPQWDKINIFYLFGTLSNMLEYKQNKQYAIFDLAQSGISFQYQFLRTFSYFILSDAVPSVQEKDQFAKFFVNCLNFIDFQELPVVVPDFEKEFNAFMNPLFNQLARYFEKLDQHSQIESCWKSLTLMYVKRREMAQGSHQIEKEAKTVMYEAVKANKPIEFDEDELQIFQHCQAFYNQTVSY